ncbi:MAG: 50S ribosomal protein L21, partial [Bdellovibrionales bacterium]|nr:50S ribosomal protein L21 [Bdellovibrionales bacterium]
MHAIIQVGGKQFTVKAGDRIRVEKIEQDLGSKVEISDVLFIGGEGQALFGQPFVSGAKVTGVVTNQDREKKIIVFKKKRRKGYRKTQGHRQWFTELFIESIAASGQSAKAETKPQVIDPAKRQARLAAQAEEIKKAHEG